MPCIPWQKFDQDYIRQRVLVTDRGCWEWQRAKTSGGYGSVSKTAPERQAHRLSWKVFRGEIPFLEEVLHSCDNPPCCNPDHLFLGSKSDNTQDAMKKGRLICDTSAAIAAKTTPQHIIDDVLLRVARNESRRSIAKIHNIHPTTVTNIINRA